MTYTATITARDANTTTGIEGSIDADITRDGAHLCSERGRTQNKKEEETRGDG